MSLTRYVASPALALMAAIAVASLAHGALFTLPVEGWAAHTQSAPPTTVGGSGNSPTFTPADNALTVLGTFPNVELKNDGDYVRVTTTLTTSTRTTNTGQNALNTLLRFGVFDGPDAAVTAGDAPNHGIFIVYGNHNQANNRRIRYNSTAGTNIFAAPGDNSNVIGAPGTEDVDQDSIRGADIGPVLFELKLTRNAGLMDIYGKISGTDSSTGRPYLSEYNHTGFDASSIGFDFDRAGFFFGNNVDAPSATLNNVTVETNVPEPSSCLMILTAALAAARIGRRRSRVA
jgi:hypothetical protein